MHVPLILRAPGRIPPQQSWGSPVENRQIAPTLLDLARVPGADRFPASSLTEALEHSDTGAQPYALASGGRVDDGEVLGLFGERFSYLGFDNDRKRTVTPFSDPLAKRPTSRFWPFGALKRGFEGAWDSYLESQRQIRSRGWSGHDDPAQVVDPQERSMLRALGYVE